MTNNTLSYLITSDLEIKFVSLPTLHIGLLLTETKPMYQSLTRLYSKEQKQGKSTASFTCWKRVDFNLFNSEKKIISGIGSTEVQCKFLNTSMLVNRKKPIPPHITEWEIMRNTAYMGTLSCTLGTMRVKNTWHSIVHGFCSLSVETCQAMQKVLKN